MWLQVDKNPSIKLKNYLIKEPLQSLHLILLHQAPYLPMEMEGEEEIVQFCLETGCQKLVFKRERASIKQIESLKAVISSIYQKGTYMYWKQLECVSNRLKNTRVSC